MVSSLADYLRYDIVRDGELTETETIIYSSKHEQVMEELQCEYTL